MQLSLQKAFATIGQKYLLTKMNAFLCLKAFKRNRFQAQLNFSICIQGSIAKEGVEAKVYNRGKVLQGILFEDE
jgi:hypothetical protein